jgi:hypothetical protein
MNLYELTANAAYLQQLLEDGDIDEQTFADSIESMMIDDKIENICKVIRNLEAQAAAFKEEAERLTKKKQTAENGVKRLKESLVNFMVTTRNTGKITAGLFTVSLGSSKSVEVLDETALPECYLTPQPPKVDKTSIGAALKAGMDVPGAQLKETNHIRIK